MYKMAFFRRDPPFHFKVAAFFSATLNCDIFTLYIHVGEILKEPYPPRVTPSGRLTATYGLNCPFPPFKSSGRY